MATRGKEMEMTPYHVKMSMNRVICSCISTSEKLISLHFKVPDIHVCILKFSFGAFQDNIWFIAPFIQGTSRRPRGTKNLNFAILKNF